ncbi:MAG: glycosyltransferase family 39 protein, partial [Planctomycetota bacterium]|nr:glycosyltransferase family 39 protein [Planctomycetota bacterium]
ISVKFFGFSPLSVFLPQVLAGVGSVLLLFHLVRRYFSASAALLSALFLAITPVWVAVNRTNNADSCLLLVLMLAAWALLKVAEEGSRYLLMLSMALIGFAFNVKMLAAYIVLPTFCVVYFIGAPQHWQRKFADLVVAILILIASSLPWVLAYELTPANSRPFVGGSRENSMLELVVGHNAVNRFFSPLKSPGTNMYSPEAKQAAVSKAKPVYGTSPDVVSTIHLMFSRIFVKTPPGSLRLADGQLAAQTAWLFPFALMAIVIAIGQSRLRRPLDARHLAVLFWLCWLVTYGVVYSYLGGIFHFYYLSTLAPALAALAGIGVVNLWNYYRQKKSYALLLPATLMATASLQLYIQASALGWPIKQFTGPPIYWLKALHYALIGGTITAAAGLLLICFSRAANRITYGLARSSFAIGLAAILILPTAWSLSNVLIPGYGLLPSADLYRLIAVTGDNGSSLRNLLKQSGKYSKLINFLNANHKNERYLLMTSTTELAAPIIINTGASVLARGGFHGIDPAVTPESLARMVETGSIRFVMLGDLTTVSRMMGSDAALKQVDDWVRTNGKLVEPSLWQSYRYSRRNMELYDLKPG